MFVHTNVRDLPSTASTMFPDAALGDTAGAIPTQPEYGKVPGSAGNSEGEGTSK